MTPRKEAKRCFARRACPILSEDRTSALAGAVRGELGTGTAYAANTIGSADIIDGQVKSVDVANQDLTSADIKDGAINTFDVADNVGVAGVDIVDGSLTGADVEDGSLTGFDIKDSFIGQAELADGTVNSAKTADNSLTSADILLSTLQGSDVAANTLTGADIDESSLSMPPTTTATFAGQGNVGLGTDVFTKVTSKSLPAGSYAIAATANVQIQLGGAGTDQLDTACELRNPSGAFIGGGRDRRSYPSDQTTTVSLSMNGGATVPAGGGEVGLYCRFQGGAYSQPRTAR